MQESILPKSILCQPSTDPTVDDLFQFFDSVGIWLHIHSFIELIKSIVSDSMVSTSSNRANTISSQMTCAC